jgi:MFS family permease
VTASASAPSLAQNAFYRRDFRLYFGGLFLGTLANEILAVVVAWQVYEVARSPLALGYVGLAQFVPMAAFAMTAGDLADRIDRRMILTAAYVVQALGAAFFLIITLLGTSTLWPFYAVLALFGSARAFGLPAAQSFLPLLVVEEQFPQAVAWTSSGRQIAVVAGPALGGAIYLLGPVAAYAICLTSLSIVAVAIATVRTSSRPRADNGESTTFERVTAGIRYLRANSIILGAISLDLFAVLLGGATALLPIYARDILFVGPTGLGLLRSAPAVGASAISILLGGLPLRRKVGVTMFGCVALFGLVTIVFGLSRSFLLSLAALVVLGASDMISVYVRATIVQLATPDAMRGRVSAVNALFIGASNQLGEFESGITAHWFGTVPSVVIGGMGTIAVVGLWMGLFPKLRKVDRMSDVMPPR